MSDPADTVVHVVWDALEPTLVAPGIERQIVHGEGMTILRVRLAAGSVLPMHQHPHLQCTQVLEGRLALRLGSGGSTEAIEVGAGEVALIAGDVPHETEALADSVLIEVFSPRRDDLPAR
jgi:quercetin dioxygenase-like cupin family protein